MKKLNKVSDAIAKYKYPILVLLIGLILLCLPSKSSRSYAAVSMQEEEMRLASVLSECRGVGETKVLLSDKGAVIVCDGAEDPNVRLDIVNSVRAYTGLGWDEIKVLKTKQK